MPGQEQIAEHLQGQIQLLSVVVQVQAVFFLIEDIGFLFTPFKVVTCGLFTFHVAYFYAAYCFRSWFDSNNRANRSALGRATKITFVASLLIWIIALAAAVNICYTYTATTVQGLTTTTVNPLGASSTATAVDASIKKINNEMHEAMMYAVNGCLGSLGIMGGSFQLAL